MTLDQLRVFVAVAERQHLTEGAKAVHLSPPAATAAIQGLEGRHGVKLFHRIGRRLELTEAGRAFLPQAQAALGAAGAAETALREFGGLRRGRLAVGASQTLANYWLPPLLMQFVAAHAGIDLTLVEGNTTTVAAAVLAGEVEIGCIEGEIDAPALVRTPLADDRLVVVGAPRHPLARRRDVAAEDLERARWIMREPGSGTRALFEAALAMAGVKPGALTVLLSLPTGEAVCGAAAAGECLTVVSELVAAPHLQSGRLQRIAYALPPRRFALIRHVERYRSRAALAFEQLLLAEAREMEKRRRLPDYEI